MAATQTVPQHSQHFNFVSILPRHGVVTLFGYGIKVHVDRGHLILQDGVGAVRHEARLPRVGHGLRRLVVIGADGVISLAALRWLADQNAAFVMLDRDGSVLATTGPVHPSDARLRRGQALAHQSGAALRIARELIDQKLAGQERLAHDGLRNSEAAQTIASARTALTKTTTIEDIRYLDYIVAEPNGAGKTTFAREFLPHYADCKNFVNADLIAQGMSPFAPEAAAFRAGSFMLTEIKVFAKQGVDFGFETTLAGRGHLHLIHDLRNRGYAVNLFFLWLPSVALALSRIKKARCGRRSRCARRSGAAPVSSVDPQFLRRISPLA